MNKKVNDQLNKFIDEKIKPQSLLDIMSEGFAKYSKYIIQERALPDARDGLKPVQRRILYAMGEMGIFHNKTYKKSARVAGEVMGKYHPHGDSSIYDAMVRLSQDFKMLVPLVDMHGNNGSIDGDSAAAMRYTEVRLTKEAEYLLEDIDKRTVNFVPNFDDEEIEPTVLPAKFPNLLVNGAMGISAGYATKIPPHNLEEVIDATIALINNPDISVDKLIKYIKGPDFPTGGIVQGKEGIISALKTGAGKVIIRAKIDVEEITKSLDRIVVTEIPYEVNKAELVRTIDNLRINNKIDDIVEIRDESDKEGLRIAIDLKKGADSQFLINYLLKNSDLQVSYNYNMVAILNHRPVLVGVYDLLTSYINHQKEVITNRSNYELEKASKRNHILDGLIKMTSVVEEVIKIIRASSNKTNAKLNLEERFGFSELQSEAIVMLQLYRLSTTDINALILEQEKLNSIIKELNEILSNEDVLLKTIKTELLNVKTVIGKPRKTEIEAEIETIKIDQTALIADEQVVVGISKEGYVKRSSLRSFGATTNVGLKESDHLLFNEEVNTLDTLLIFTNLGNYIFLPVYEIDDQRWGDMGIFISNIVPTLPDERIIKVLLIESFKTNRQILLATKNGLMKQSNLSDFEVSRYNRTIRAMKLDKKDELVAVDIDQKENIISLSKNGYGLRVDLSEIPTYGLQAGGIKAMALRDDDELRAALYINESDDYYILTSRGHLIKDSTLAITKYPRNRRGNIIVDKLKSSPHFVIGASRLSKAQIKEDVKVLLFGSKDYLDIKVSDLKPNYNKYGEKLLNNGEFIYIAKPKDEENFVEIVDELKETKEEVKILEPKVKEETIITKQKQKIRISRLDLFDDE